MTLSPDDWNTVREWASPAIAFFALIVATLSHRRAIREANLKVAESQMRANETKKYAETLEKFARAAQFAEHLKGMDERVGTISDHLESLARKSSEITEIASIQIGKSMEHLRKATAAMDDISHQLREIAKTALVSQRQALDNSRSGGSSGKDR